MSDSDKELEEILLWEKHAVGCGDIECAMSGHRPVLDNTIQRLNALIGKKVREAEIALARKVLAVSGGHHKIKGFTQAKRLKLLTDKMNEIIPDTFGIVEEAQLQDNQAKEGV